MTETLDPALVRDLFGTPPPEFVAARNALAKSLRADRRRDVATTVTALRRPSWVDWALNAIAGARGEEVEGFADAAAQLREAQAAAIEGRDGPDLRTSLRGLREATTTLARLATRGLSDAGRTPDAAEVAARLGEIAASQGAVDQLRSGVLGSGDPDETGPFGDLGREASSAGGARTTGRAATDPSQGETSTAGKQPASSEGTSAPTRRRQSRAGTDELAARRAAAEARKEGERRRAEEEAAAAAAEKAVQAAAQAERDRADATGAVEAAETALTDAEQALAEAEQAVTDARDAVIRAKVELRSARKRLDGLSRRK